jgi:hypothetical protein
MVMGAGKHRGPLLWVLLGSACASGSQPPVMEHPAANPEGSPASVSSDDAPDVTPLDLSEQLQAVEDELIAVDFTMRFELESEGLVVSRLAGELRSQGDTLSLRARGSFEGQPVELILEADGQRLRGANGRSTLELPQPAALEEAVVIGLTRMGLLHNLAMLVGARPPDRADGGVREWVQANAVVGGSAVGPAEPSDSTGREQPKALSFGIVVAGEHVGDATLWYDPASKLPLERHQLVSFPGGEMRVRETYDVQWLRR